MDQYFIEKTKEPDSFDTRMVIDHIIQPWLASEDDGVKEIANGLIELESTIGSEGFNNYLAMIMQGFGLIIRDQIYDDSVEFCLFINTFFQVGFCLQVYRQEKMDRLSPAKI